VLEVLYHRAKFGEARISRAAGAAQNVEVLQGVIELGDFKLRGSGSPNTGALCCAQCRR